MLFGGPQTTKHLNSNKNDSKNIFRPPVVKNTYGSQQSQSKRFCFQTEVWQKVISISYELKIVHRQKDAEFIRILNLIRVGHVNDDIAKRLMQTSKHKVEDFENGILATQLCSHTNDSNLINESKLSNLKTEERLYNVRTFFACIFNKNCH